MNRTQGHTPGPWNARPVAYEYLETDGAGFDRYESEAVGRCNNCLTEFESDDTDTHGHEWNGPFECPKCNTAAYLMDLVIE